MNEIESEAAVEEETGMNWEVGETGGLYPMVPDKMTELSSEMSALDVYMARLQHMDPLDDETQRDLAIRYQNGDAEAGQVLLMTNLRLVIKIAMDYTRDRDDLLELIQEGNLGISKALGRYDPDKNVKFTSYAQYWIRAKILDYLINRGRPIRLGSSRAGRKIFYNLNKAKRELRKMGEEPTTKKLAEYLDVPEKEIVRVGTQMEESPVSLDEQLSDDGGKTYGDLMESEMQSPEEQVGEAEVMDTFRKAMREFGEQIEEPRRRAIWYERTIAEEPKILRELGAQWDVSKERIRQIESELCDEFRIFFTDRLGDGEEVEYALSA